MKGTHGSTPRQASPSISDRTASGDEIVPCACVRVPLSGMTTGSNNAGTKADKREIEIRRAIESVSRVVEGRT